MRFLRTVGVAVALSTPPILSAQLPAYNIPDDPAFSFLGVAPKKVASPGTVSALGLAIADGIDIEGRVNAGLAVSFLLSSIVRYSPSPEKYRNGTPRFWLYNTQMSVATIRASGDTGATELAFGARTIFRGPEPYTDQAFRNSIASVLDRCGEATGVDSSTIVIQNRVGVRVAETPDPADPTKLLKPNAGTTLAEDTLEITYLDAKGNATRTERAVVRKIRNGKRITQDTVRTWEPRANTRSGVIAVDCAMRGKANALKAWMERHWNDATLALSAGAGTRFGRSSIRRTQSLGTGLWLLGAAPIRWTRRDGSEAKVSNFGQIAAQLHYANAPQAVPGASGNSWDWGLRALGGAARYNVFAEVTRSLKKGQSGPEARAWSTGVEYMAAESIWLSVGVGDRFSQVTSDAKTFVFMNLKWGLARESHLGG